MVLDVGAGNTEIGIFNGSTFVYTNTISLGGDNITNDISYCLNISKEEADSVKSLILTQYRTDMFEVSTYEDLANFPNLEKLWLGESKLETVDLSNN